MPSAEGIQGEPHTLIKPKQNTAARYKLPSSHKTNGQDRMTNLKKRTPQNHPLEKKTRKIEAKKNRMEREKKSADRAPRVGILDATQKW